MLLLRPRRPIALRSCIHGLGALMLTAHASSAILSYPLAASLWQEAEFPRIQRFLADLAEVLQPVLPSARAWLAEGRLFGDALGVVVGSWSLLAIATASAVLLMLALARWGDEIDPGTPRALLIWSTAFAVACIPAFPVFAQDFWLSPAWGRMIAAGVNPYYSYFTPEAVAGLPLDHFPIPTPYGPLWGAMSGILMTISGGSVLAAALAFKAVLAATWIGSLYLVARLVEGATVRDQSLSIALLGWLPVGVSQSIAEGHNDIVMACLALLWLFLLIRGRVEAPLALAASALCKYITAPLLLIDMIYLVRRRSGRWHAYGLRLLPAALFGLAVVGIFYRSPQFFDGLREVRGWHFLQPTDAVRALEIALGISLSSLRMTALAFFPAVAAYWACQLWNRPDVETLLKSAIALMAAILFVAVSHVWPWYLVWVLSLAALVPRWWLSRLIAGVAIAAPFTLACWWIDDLSPYLLDAAALVMYLIAGLYVWLTRAPSLAPAPCPPVVSDRTSQERLLGSGTVARG